MLASIITAAAIAASGSLTVDVLDGRTARSIPPGAQRVLMLTLRLAASCDGDVPLRSITVRHRGLGDSADIESVYLLQGGARITRGRSIAARSGRVTFSLRDVVISSCKSEELTVAADFATTAAVAGEHRFIITGPQDIDASGASVRVRSQRLPFGMPHAPTVPSGTARGRIDITYPPLHRAPTYGSHQLLGRFRFAVDGRDDQELRSMTLTNEGSARGSDLQNLVLMTGGGKAVTAVARSMDTDRLMLTFSPLLRIGRNAEQLLELRGDVRAPRRRTIRFVVQEPNDLVGGVSDGRRQ